MCLFSVYLCVCVCVCLEHLAWLDEREREPLRASSPVWRAPPPIAATPSHCQRWHHHRNNFFISLLPALLSLSPQVCTWNFVQMCFSKITPSCQRSNSFMARFMLQWICYFPKSSLKHRRHINCAVYIFLPTKVCTLTLSSTPVFFLFPELL